MMAEGAGGTYYFHYMPYPGDTGGFGNFLSIDENYQVTSYPPQYLAAQVITKEWVQPIDAPHKLFKVSSDVNDAAGNVLVTAYAVERPDGQWSVMLVNRDQYNDHAVKIAFTGAAGRHRHRRHFSGQVDRITFGSNEYQWHREGTEARGPRRPGRPALEIHRDWRRRYAVPASESVDHRAARQDHELRSPTTAHSPPAAPQSSPAPARDKSRCVAFL